MQVHFTTRELVVTADLSENYCFVLQDAAQEFHWNNTQATIRPFVAYHIDSIDLCHMSYVVITPLYVSVCSMIQVKLLSTCSKMAHRLFEKKTIF